MFKRWLDGFELKRLALILLGPGFLLLGVDSWIGHFAGKDEGETPIQFVPVYFSVVAAGFLVAWALPRLPALPFRLGVFLIGLLSVGVGLWGTVLHLLALKKDLGDDPVSWGARQGSLALSPPVFAPLAFAGIGALLAVLAHPRLNLGWLPKGEATPAPAALAGLPEPTSEKSASSASIDVSK